MLIGLLAGIVLGLALLQGPDEGAAAQSAGPSSGPLSPPPAPRDAAVARAKAGRPSPVFGCINPRIVDGDTLRCGAVRIRLSGIDAPELGRCRPGRNCAPGDPVASTEHLAALVAGGRVDCRQTDTDRYGRVVARCTAQGRDLSCAQIAAGHAIRRYAALTC